MEAMPVGERMSAEEFLALPVTDRTRFASLVDGEVVVNDPRPLHNYVTADLEFALQTWARAEPGRGRVMIPLDVLLGRSQRLQARHPLVRRGPRAHP